MEKHLESISTFWKDNEISVAECAENIYEFLLILQKHNNVLFQKWYEQGNSKKEALKNKVELSQECFYKIVKQNWDKKFPHLGSSFTLWTGNIKEGHSASISFRLGAYGNKPHIKSSCVISFPYEGEQMRFYMEETNRQNLIKLMIGYWKPNKVLINGEVIENLNTFM